MSLVPPTAALAGLGYMSYLAFCPEGRPKPSGRCNKEIRLSEGKVVDSIDVEDIAEKAAFCRCWKSKNVRIFFTILYDRKNSHLSFYSGPIVMVPMVHIIKLPVITLDQWLLVAKRLNKNKIIYTHESIDIFDE